MARSFDGANDEIDFGADASINGFTTKSMSMWALHDTASVNDIILAKDREGTHWAWKTRSADDTTELYVDFSTTDGRWRSTTPLGTVFHHIALTYDGGAVGNDPVFYLDGAVDATIDIVTPVGSIVSDATPTLRVGEDGAQAADWAGDIGWLCYANAVWDAAQINRAKWWGTPGGAFAVYHPFWTEELVNKGTGTATGVVAGSVVINAAIPRVERMWGSFMGVGR